MATVRRAIKEREKARKFWDRLSNAGRWELGDELVLGNVDYDRWFDGKPSSVFLNEVDRQRMYWESEEE